MNNESHISRLARSGVERLRREDPALHDALEQEYQRQANRLMMVASCSVVDSSALACEAGVAVNVTAEGFPGARYHAGCEMMDVIESLAIERAKSAFGAVYANVQPHSASTANQMVMATLLKPGETLMGLSLKSGGHLSHGSAVNFSGSYFNAVSYGLTAEGKIDYDGALSVAREHKPKLIFCGTTAHSRTIDFERFRAIADDVGAYLVADISHIAGLVVAGLHPSPIDVAHVTTTCTHKQLFGPRGGLILCGKDHEALGPDGKTTLALLMQRALFPFFQGAPIMNAIAAKARALARVQTAEFKATATRIRDDAQALARTLAARGYRIVSGGTDNHIVLVDLSPFGLSGRVLERALEESFIVVNKNSVPGDTRSPHVTSGVRLGTNTLALRGFTPEDVTVCVELIDEVRKAVKMKGDTAYELPAEVRDAVRKRVLELCAKFPLPYEAAP